MTAEKKKLRVGVMFGGRSGEHEVSLASAASVIRALDPEKYEAVPIGITKDGRWLVGTTAQKMLPEVLRTGEHVTLTAEPDAAALVPLENKGAGALRVDVVFPVLHGTYGEDGTVQGLLELAGLPFVGSGVLGSAVGMDKDIAKRLFLQEGLPVGDYLAIPRSQWEQSRAKVLSQVRKKFNFPVFHQARLRLQLIGRHDESARRQGITEGARFCSRIRAETPRREVHQWARD